jgi:glycosyltransferase involved in cell wall biosynthesis
MTLSHPCVTVVIPAYNAAATIRRALDSVLAQTFQDIETVVIDDASGDATADIVTRQYGAQVRLLRLPRNAGESAAMNAGIAEARGRLIAFLDADDEWLPEKLERQVAALEQHPRAVMAVSGCRFQDRLGRLLREESIAWPGAAPDEVWRLLLARTLIAKPCVAVRSDALRRAGPFDVGLAIGADQDMWIRLALLGEVIFLPEVLTVVHDTAGSLTKVHADKADRYMLPMIRRHIEQQRSRLARSEVRAILAERYTTVGRNLYVSGALLRGVNLLLCATLLGHAVPENLWYLLTASPPARCLKRQARRLTGAGASWSRRSAA